MPHFKMLLLLPVSVMALSALAADPAPAVHWYSITIASGTSTTTFTGSSPMNPDELSSRVTATSPILLENRREAFASEKYPDYGWHPEENAQKVHIVPRSVLYFEELSGDPAAKPN